ncbi:MAG: DUF1772 domain-containing protein [Vicinamibacteraceae bacterium]
MTLFQAVLMTATVLCSLVAGFLFAFAVVVMPGIGRLDDAGFLRAFQVIDRVIQNNQPLFIVVWLGAVLALVAAAAMGVWNLTGSARLLVIVAALVYLLGVQLPTVTINLPLNSQVQKLDVVTMNEMARQRARNDFEPRWNRWNVIRTACAVLVSILLVFLVLRA